MLATMPEVSTISSVLRVVPRCSSGRRWPSEWKPRAPRGAFNLCDHWRIRYVAPGL